jgi:hypothetical protein
MATPLDGGLLQQFGDIFPFLFVFVLVFGLLSKTKIFGDKNFLYGMIAFIMAIMVQFSIIVKETINTIAPWFVLMIFFIFIVMIGVMALGVTEGDITGVLKSEQYNYINFWIIAVVIIIVVGSLTSVISRQGGIGKTGGEVINQTIDGEVVVSEQESEFWSTLAHPKVLGMVLILLISLFTVQRLAK